MVGSYLVAAETSFTAAEFSGEVELLLAVWSRAAIPGRGLTERVHEIRSNVPSISGADAAHLALAERLDADFFVTCDDRLAGQAMQLKTSPRLRILDPLAMLTELGL